MLRQERVNEDVTQDNWPRVTIVWGVDGAVMRRCEGRVYATTYGLLIPEADHSEHLIPWHRVGNIYINVLVGVDEES